MDFLRLWSIFRFVGSMFSFCFLYVVIWGLCFLEKLVVFVFIFVVFVFGGVVVQLNDKDLFVGIFRFRGKLGFWVVGWGVVGG